MRNEYTTLRKFYAWVGFIALLALFYAGVAKVVDKIVSDDAPASLETL